MMNEAQYQKRERRGEQRVGEVKKEKQEKKQDFTVKDMIICWNFGFIFQLFVYWIAGVSIREVALSRSLLLWATFFALSVFVINFIKNNKRIHI